MSYFYTYAKNMQPAVTLRTSLFNES